MFVYGILVETRVFGELIPFIVCASALILEQMLVTQMTKVVTLEPESPETVSITQRAA